MRPPQTILSSAPTPTVPVDQGEARETERAFVDDTGKLLRSMLWGQGIHEVELVGSSFTGWVASARLGSGRVVTTPLGLDLVLHLFDQHDKREARIEAVADHCRDALLREINPPEVVSENDMVSEGYLGDVGLGQVELHPDVAHKLGDLKHELHQIITGRKL